MDTGSTAWILTSTALVLFMTMPGLAYFMEDWLNQKMYFQFLCIVLGLLVLLP